MKSSTASLTLGSGSVKITPPVGAWMMGYGKRTHGCEGVHDDLFAQALVLRQGETETVLFATDLGSFSREPVRMLKERLHREFGLREEQILINNSHTHAGPLVGSRMYTPVKPDPQYLRFIEDRFVEAVRQARSRSQSVRLYHGLSHCDIAMSRRLKTSKGIEYRPDPKAVVDRECHTLVFRDERDLPVAAIFSVACHPTILPATNYLISAEWPGAARRILETYFTRSRRTAAGQTDVTRQAADQSPVPVLFLQAAAGEVKANLLIPDGTDFAYGNFDDVERAGERVARSVIGAINGPMREIQPRLRAGLRVAALPLQAAPDVAGFQRVLDNPASNAWEQAWAKHWLDFIKDGKTPPKTAACAIHAIEFSPDLRLVGLEGELTTGIGLGIKRLLEPSQTITLGYTNGSVGYLPTARIIEEGGYERDSYIYFDLPSPFAPAIESVILEDVRQLIAPSRKTPPGKDPLKKTAQIKRLPQRSIMSGSKAAN